MGSWTCVCYKPFIYRSLEYMCIYIQSSLYWYIKVTVGKLNMCLLQTFYIQVTRIHVYIYTVKPVLVYKGDCWEAEHVSVTNLLYTVKPVLVYKGHCWEAEHVSVTNLLYTGSDYIHYACNETALYIQWVVLYRCPLRQVWLESEFATVFTKSESVVL